MKILEKKQSELIPRTEVSAEIEHTSKATPSKEAIKEAISKDAGADKELIAIKSVYTKFGEGKSKVSAYIYKDKDSFNKLEIFHKKLKAKKKEEPTKQEKK